MLEKCFKYPMARLVLQRVLSRNKKQQASYWPHDVWLSNPARKLIPYINAFKIKGMAKPFPLFWSFPHKCSSSQTQIAFSLNSFIFHVKIPTLRGLLLEFKASLANYPEYWLPGSTVLKAEIPGSRFRVSVPGSPFNEGKLSYKCKWKLVGNIPFQYYFFFVSFIHEAMPILVQLKHLFSSN